MKSLILPILIGLSVVLSGCNLNQSAVAPVDESLTAPLQEVDQHASLAIVINGTPLDLTKSQYSQVNDLAYLDAKNPGIIQIKKSPLTWSDFFEQTPFVVTPDCLTIDIRSTYCSEGDAYLKVFLNGVRIHDPNNRLLSQGDELLLSYGSEEGDVLLRQLSLIPKL